MSNVINIGRRRPHVFLNPTSDADRNSPVIAANKWQMHQIVERLKVMYGDDVAKQVMFDVANEFWPVE